MRARMKYALSAAGIIDLIAVLPFWFTMVLPTDFRFVLVFRMVRFFKIARYSPAMRSLLDVLYNERRASVRLPGHRARQRACCGLADASGGRQGPAREAWHDP